MKDIGGYRIDELSKEINPPLRDTNTYFEHGEYINNNGEKDLTTI